VRRKLLGPLTEGVTGDLWKLNNEEFHDLYSPSNIILGIKSKRMGGAGHVLCMGERRGAYRVLVGKPEGKKPRRRPRGGWKDNIIMDFIVAPWILVESLILSTNNCTYITFI